MVYASVHAVEDELEEDASDESFSEHDTHSGELRDSLEEVWVLHRSLQQRAGDYQASEPEQQVQGGVES